jgi:hypothetical protein
VPQQTAPPLAPIIIIIIIIIITRHCNNGGIQEHAGSALLKLRSSRNLKIHNTMLLSILPLP